MLDVTSILAGESSTLEDLVVKISNRPVKKIHFRHPVRMRAAERAALKANLQVLGKKAEDGEDGPTPEQRLEAIEKMASILLSEDDDAALWEACNNDVLKVAEVVLAAIKELYVGEASDSSA